MSDTPAIVGELTSHGVLPPPPRRFEAPRELTWRHRLLAVLMIVGSSDARLLGFVTRTERVREGKKFVSRPIAPPKPGEPLPVDEAASLAGLKRRYSRALVDTPIFKAELVEQRRKLLGSTRRVWP